MILSRSVSMLLWNTMFLVVLVCGAGNALAETSFAIDRFDYKTIADLQRTWQGTYPAEISKKDFGGGSAGVVFPCQFSKSGDRCFWDRSLSKPQDLSEYQYFRISMHVDDGMSIKERSVSFAVADPTDPAKTIGWYSYMLPETAGGIESYLMAKSAFSAEGDIKDGWSRIREVRISFWGGMNASVAKATLIRLEASVAPTKTDFELVKTAPPVGSIADLQIIPAPQKWIRKAGQFRYPSRRIPVTHSDNEATNRVVKLVQPDIEIATRAVLVPNAIAGTDSRFNVVFVGNPKEFTPAALKQMIDGEALVKDSYRLSVNEEGILLVAVDEKGLFYGMQTLRQLLQVSDEGVSAACGTITDFPSLDMRAMYLHWIGGPQGYEKTKEFIKALAALKINTIFIDVGPKMKYESRDFPVTGKDAFSKQEMRDLAAFAREHYVNLCPWYQLFGHTPWIGAEPKYRHLMETPDHVNWYSSWCPSNPETFQFAKDILGEAIEVFNPPYVHIAHDEIDFTDLGSCEKCKPQRREDLIVKSMNTLSDFMTEKNVKTIVSGDTFLPWLPRNTFDKQLDGDRILQGIRKSIIINQWCYGGDYEMHDKVMKPSEAFGFTGPSQVFSPWYHAHDIRISAQIMKDRQGLGVIGTFWHDWGTIQNYPALVADHCLGVLGLTATFAWNPNSPPVEYEQIDWNYRIRRVVEPTWSLPHPDSEQAYESISLAKSVNAALKGKPAAEAGVPVNLELPSHITVDGLPLAIEPRSQFVMLRGHPSDSRYPATVAVLLGKKAGTLYFLHAVSEPDDLKIWQTPERIQLKPVVGKYTVVYDDDSAVVIPLNYRLNITSWNSQYGFNNGRVAWQGSDSKGRLVRLGCMPWQNPNPGKVIVRVDFSSEEESGMNPMLFAITTGSR